MSTSDRKETNPYLQELFLNDIPKLEYIDLERIVRLSVTKLRNLLIRAPLSRDKHLVGMNAFLKGARRIEIDDVVERLGNGSHDWNHFRDTISCQVLSNGMEALWIHIGAIHQDVAWCDIAMCNALFMHECDSLENAQMWAWSVEVGIIEGNELTSNI